MKWRRKPTNHKVFVEKSKYLWSTPFWHTSQPCRTFTDCYVWDNFHTIHSWNANVNIYRNWLRLSKWIVVGSLSFTYYSLHLYLVLFVSFCFSRIFSLSLSFFFLLSPSLLSLSLFFNPPPSLAAFLWSHWSPCSRKVTHIFDVTNTDSR